MKKLSKILVIFIISFMFLFTTIVMSSCSKDDENDDQSNEIEDFYDEKFRFR